MIGKMIDNYRVIEQLGEGGMGTVYKAVDVMLEREVAIKMLRPELSVQPELVERFRSEAVTLANISHPNIATLFGMSKSADALSMIMEFVKGETLESLLQRTGKIPIEHAVPLCCQVLDALEYAHENGVVHRDIKLANLMINVKGQVKVMDFGIARVLGTQRRTRTGFMVGTMTYMSPEQIRGQDVDGRTDIYSLGIALYEMIGGRPPFIADTEYDLMQAHIQKPPPPPRQLVPGIQDWLEAAIMRALVKEPAGRHQTAAEFRDVLTAGLQSTQAGRQSKSYQAPPIPLVMPDSGVKPTRLAESTPTPGEFVAGTTPPQGPRETRLAQPEPDYGSVRQAPPPRVAAAGGVWNSRDLNWKHLTGAAAILIILLSLLGWWLLSPAPEVALSEGSEPAAPMEPDPQPVASNLNRPPQSSAPPPTYRPPARTEPSPIQPTPRTPARQDPAVPPPLKPPPAITQPSQPPPATTTPVKAAQPVKKSPASRFPPISFEKVKILSVQGDKSDEEDAVLRLGSTHVTVAYRKTDKTYKSFPYRTIASATYSKSKHPRWKSGLGAAAALGVFAAPVFFMKGTKHWLTLQTESDYLVLRLDKNNYQTILPAIEVRTGLKVDVIEEK